MRTAHELDAAGPLTLRRRGPRLFATPADEPRARRASDAISLAGALIALVCLAWIAQPPAGFLKSLTTFLQISLPPFLDPVWQIALDVLVLLAIAVIVIASVRRRWTLVRDLLLAVLVSFAFSMIVGRIVSGSWPELWESFQVDGPPSWFPSPRVTISGAVLFAASPYLSLPARRAARWLVWIAALAVCCLGAAAVEGAVAAVIAATVSASIVHLVLGSCGGRPGLHDVAVALQELGVRTSSVAAAQRQMAGRFTVSAVDEQGPLVVKVYGRDADDTQLLSSVWRTVWYRSADASFALSRSQHVEHEAFITLLAAQAGVTTFGVVTAGSTTGGDALLVLRPVGVRLEELADDHPRDREHAANLWQVLHRLHRAGISPREVDDRHVIIDGDEVGLVDFGGAIVAPEREQMLSDEAQALITSVLAFGEDVALDAAQDAIGTAGLADVLPFLQIPALTARHRFQIRNGDLDLAAFRERTANRAGVTSPELRRLRRVTWGSLLQTGLLLLACVALASAFSHLDVDTIVDTLRDATWWLVVLGFVFGQLPRVTQSVATLGACPIPLPLGPVYALQLAISYINLAIPSTAARVAVNIRFFQRHGLQPGSAVAIGALDGFSGFIVQACILVTIIVFSPISLDLNLDVSDASGMLRLLLIVVVIAVAAIAVVLIVPRLRRTVFDFVRKFAAEAMVAVRSLRSPRRIAMLFGGNLATEILFAITLGIFTRSVGYHIGLGELLLINVSVALFAGLMPIPGGIGVSEGGLTLGLVGAGMPEEVAFAAVMMYRVATFYLPPIWGFFAFKWLQRHQHL